MSTSILSVIGDGGINSSRAVDGWASAEGIATTSMIARIAQREIRMVAPVLEGVLMRHSVARPVVYPQARNRMVWS
jgi:hypothetical protein